MNAPITYPVNLFLINIGTFLSLTLGIFLVLKNSPKNRANLYLGLLTLVLSFSFLNGFLYRFDLLMYFPHIIGINVPLLFAIGPLSYLYVRACTQKEFEMRPILFLHFLPVLIDALFFSPTLYKSGAEKIDMYLTLIKDGTLFQNHYIFVIKAIQGITYIAFAARLILEYRKHVSNTTSTIDYAYHQWMQVFLFVMTCPLVGLLGYVIVDYSRVLIVILLLSFFCFFVIVYFMVMVKPEVFHTFPHQIPVAEIEEEAQKEKYEWSKLDPVQKETYLQKLLTLMEREKPYQAPELTLDELSEQVKISAHHVSQIINEKLNVNFLDFINGYRVKEAQQKLKDPKLSHYTIVAIAYEAGFNSKSTFYSVFKKHTGVTPSEYRKQVASFDAVES